ncbi:ABC transporter substrate-binding protein [Bernardetia sp. ABR2-2B]|uniref:ABC transporter substrate-binding protein n=1 Tax=Bernardetia sp. ABR2-2B TaxID=3127472 RepID=UPI0030CE4572
MKKLRIALDWTPNINHIGIFIAKELGFYKELEIETTILNPLEDNYALTPGKKLELDETDFAIAPFETVISLNNKKNVVDAIAVFAILQEDISSIATLKSSKIDRPKILDGKIYASYKARYEDYIVKQMVKNDGGTGAIELVYPEKLGIWNILLENKADATWIFNNWEGIEAESKNVALNKFSLGDFDIPYCYSPVIITKNSNLKSQKEEYSNFIKATQKGYLCALENKLEAIKILEKHLTEYDKQNVDLEKSINFTAPYFKTDSECGSMKTERVSSFLNWLVDNKLENERILHQDLFTNELLKLEKQFS